MAAPQNFVSVSRRPPDVEDYIDILRRYRSWVIGPTFAGLVISVVAAFLWPDMYMCYASMQIKPGAVADLVQSNSSHLQERLSQLQIEILSRDNLVTMVTNPKFDLYKKERAKLTNEDVAEQYLAKAIKVVGYSNDGQMRGAQAFRIEFKYPDRIKARQVVVNLVEQFQNKNLQLQSTQSGTRGNFLDSEVTKAKEQMEKAQNDIAAFSAENAGRLPDDAQTNAMAVQNKTVLLSNIRDAITADQQRLALLQSNLSNNKNAQTQVEANSTTQQTTQNAEVKNSNLIYIQGQITNKNAELQGLRRKYQDNFPDVLKAKEELKALEDTRDSIQRDEQANAGNRGTTVQTVRNPQADQALASLRSQEGELLASMRVTQMSIENKQRQEARAEKELKEAQDKVATSPAASQKYSQLNTELTMARTKYENLSVQKTKSDTEKNAEELQASDRLDILENPVAPDTPVSPVRGAIVGIGTAAGLALGLALAGGKELKNTSLKNLKDVRAYTNLPVLSSVPLLENALLVRRKRRLSWLAWSCTVIIGSILMSGAVYYYYVVAQQVS